MKYKFLILAVALFIVAFVSYSYLFSKLDPAKLFNELYEKQSQIKEYSLGYSLNYSLNITESVGNGVGNTSQTYGRGVINMTKLENARKVVVKDDIHVEYYDLPQGKFVCTTPPHFVCTSVPVGAPLDSNCRLEPGELECRQLEPADRIIQKIMIPQDQLDLLNSLTKEGVVNITLDGTQEIIDRECYEFKFNVNVEKAMSQLNLSTFNYSNLKNINLTFFECLDKSSGLPLFSKIFLAINNSTTAQSGLTVTTKATALSFNLGVNKIELPTSIKNT
jgi:hypothetical protein